MNFKRGYQWIEKKTKSLLFAVAAITLVTAFGYYIGVSGEDAAEDCKMDVFKFSFVFAIPWCLSSWLALRIGQKLDGKIYDWQTKLCSLFFGPIMLTMFAMEYLKQRKRAKYIGKEMHSRKKDIYDLWDWLFPWKSA
jgi:hypothetical protein